MEHYDDVVMGVIASQITSLTIFYSIVYSDADQRKHQSSASLAFVRGIHWGPVNSPNKWPVTRKMFPFDDVIMKIPLLDNGSNNFSKQQHCYEITRNMFHFPDEMCQKHDLQFLSKLFLSFKIRLCNLCSIPQ